MTTAKRRLRVLEELFIGQVERHVGQVLPLFLARYHGDELRQVAAFLRSVAGEDHDAQRATAGAALLRDWKLSMGEAQWRAMWLTGDVLESVNAAIATLSPTELAPEKAQK